MDLKKSNNSKKIVDFDDFEYFISKKKNEKKSKDDMFRNNYKNFQYDYEEDFYEPKY